MLVLLAAVAWHFVSYVAQPGGRVRRDLPDRADRVSGRSEQSLGHRRLGAGSGARERSRRRQRAERGRHGRRARRRRVVAGTGGDRLHGTERRADRAIRRDCTRRSKPCRPTASTRRRARKNSPTSTRRLRSCAIAFKPKPTPARCAARPERCRRARVRPPTKRCCSPRCSDRKTFRFDSFTRRSRMPTRRPSSPRCSRPSRRRRRKTSATRSKRSASIRRKRARAQRPCANGTMPPSTASSRRRRGRPTRS